MKSAKRIPLLAAVLAVALAVGLGCSAGDDDDLILPETGGFRINATIPHYNQYDVPLASRVVVNFSEFPDPETLGGRVHLQRLDAEGAPDADVEYTMEQVGDSLKLTPAKLLEIRTRYRITIDAGVTALLSRSVIADEWISEFETSIRRPQAAERLSVVRTLPADDELCPDFQTFRVYFNEPVNRKTAWYGSAVRFVDVASEELVPGNLFARGNQIVFDPDADLTPGRTYRLIVTQNLRDDNGQALAEDFAVDYVPVDTGDLVDVAMDQCPTVVEGSGFCEAVPSSEIGPNAFTGLQNNTLFADSVLLGPTNIETGGRLWSEFADAKMFPNETPFVLRKGQVITARDIDSKVGGEIPSGVNSGTFYITLMTDAVGYLAGSEFVHGRSGLPATVLIKMDAAIGTEDPSATSVLGQPIFGVTLVGQASVYGAAGMPDYEAMQIEVAGFAETLLVNERAASTMSMLLVPPPTKPEKVDTSVPLDVLTVSPTAFARRVNAADEVIVVFSTPVDPDTVRANIRLTGPYGQVDVDYDVYNPKVVMTPTRALDPETKYYIEVDAGLTDLLGKPIVASRRYDFETNTRQTSTIDPPLYAGSFPGRADGITMPAHFTTDTFFTQLMDPASFVYGETIGLYDDTSGGTLIPATPINFGLFVHVVPDRYLVAGHQYRWVITSLVTNIDGLMLDTDEDRVPGGPDIVIPFTATEETDEIETMLYTYEYADTDVNGFIEGPEYETSSNRIDVDSILIGDPIFEFGYMPITVGRIFTDETDQPRVPIAIEPGSIIWATSTGVSIGGKEPEPGLLEMGRVRIEQLPGSTSDLVPAADGLTAVDVDAGLDFQVENQFMNDLLVHESSLVVLSTLRFTEDGRMLVIVRGPTAFAMRIPILGEISMDADVSMDVMTIPSRRDY